MREIRGAPIGSPSTRIGIVVAAFNDLITRRLLDGAIETLQAARVSAANLTVVHVPGAFELPVAARALADAPLGAGRVDGILALGCVIRGETPHFDFVAGEATAGLARVAADSGVPIGFGLLTCDTSEQALARAGLKGGNKGADAATALLQTLDVLRQLAESDGAAPLA